VAETAGIATGEGPGTAPGPEKGRGPGLAPGPGEDVTGPTPETETAREGVRETRRARDEKTLIFIELKWCSFLYFYCAH